MTDNHGYNTPPKGEPNWHLPLNENFTNLDTDVEIRDLEGNLDTYTPTTGAKFLAKDTGAVYLGDGSAWQKFGNITSIGRSVRPKEGGAGIQQAAEELKETGGVIRLTEGTYVVDDSITIYNDQHLIGAGIDRTRIEAGAVGGEGNQIVIGTGNDRDKRIVDLTIDAKNSGASCLSWSDARRAYAIRCKFVNGGTRDGSTNSSGGKIRAGDDATSHDFGFIHCVADNNSAVSLDCGSTSGGTLGSDQPRRAVFIGNNILSCNNSNRFTHGLAAEGTNFSVVMGNRINGQNQSGNHGLSPGININSSSESTVVGNTMWMCQKGIALANSEGVGTLISNNTIYSFTKVGIHIKKTNTFGQGVEDNQVQGNLIDGAGVSGDGAKVGDDAHANFYHNVFRDIGGTWGIHIRGRSPKKPCHIVGNRFVDWNGKAFTHDDDGTDEVLMVSHNYIERVSLSENEPAAIIRKSPGVMIGNVFENEDSAHMTASVVGGEWFVFANYFRSGLAGADSSVVNNNVLEDGSVLAGDATRATDNVHRGSGSITDGSQSYPVGGVRQGTYTGDGTSSHRINTFMDPTYVVVEDSAGTKYDIHATWGQGYLHNDPGGSLSLLDGGFSVDAGGSDADPNTDGETYTFYAE